MVRWVSISSRFRGERLRFSKATVSLLLLSAVITGMKQTLPTGSTSAATIIYTTTSTSYYYWRVTVTSTQFVITSVSILSQSTIDGPYLRIEGNFQLNPSGSSGFIIVVTNLMSVPVEKGNILFRISNLAETVSDEVVVAFGEVKPGRTIRVDQGVSLYYAYSAKDVKVTPIRVEMSCNTVIQIPVTPILVQNYVSTVEYLYTRTLSTTGGVGAPTLNWRDNTLALLGGIGVFVVLLLMFVNRRRSAKEKVSPPKPAEKVKLVEKENGRIAVFLAKLDELRQQGKITEQVYNKLKEEYRKRLSESKNIA